MIKDKAPTRWQRMREAIHSIPETIQRRLQICLTLGPIFVWVGWAAFLRPYSPCDDNHHPAMCAVYTAMAMAANTSVENINAAIYVAFGIAMICAAVADLILWWQGRRK
ncbi:hypothetical protein [Aquitalea pelogenes]|uniref:hypothetical protein n=1 Tax=Aquitalea pelogenes TaxID=1293573 RepID=UPI0035B0CFE1